jgi:hypothetical protein
MTVRLLLTIVCGVATPFVWGATGDPSAGIPGTAHDFSGIAVAGSQIANTGTCTFCHTPHNASSQELLWNQAANSHATYTWTNLTTTGSTPYATITSTTNTGPSVKCMSCHDGSAASGDMGWFNGVNPPPIALGMRDEWKMGEGGSMDGNHPVSMPFPTGGASAAASTYNGVANGAAAVASDWVLETTAQTAGIRFFNDSVGDGTGISAGIVATETGIECSSCHDPHNGGTVQDIFFLRGEIGGNTADYICAKCHDR